VGIEGGFILLFIVATAVAIAVRRLQLPYTVALVLAGLVLGALHLFPAPHLTRDLLFSVFLPGLLFEAAFHIDLRDFWRNRIMITALAVPGVVASTALVALILAPVAQALNVAHGFNWRYALVFGALISATDPIAVVSLFRTMGAPRRLTMLVDGESLLNDGTSIVFFTLSLSLLAGTVVGPGHIALQFVSIVGMGAVIGGAIGAAASIIMRRVDDPMIEITLTTIAAYGAFIAAESLGYSGVIATVAAGTLCGNFGARTGMSPSTRIASATFWEYVVFALNSIVFLLIGFEISLPMLLTDWLPIVLAYTVVTASRALVICASRALLGRTRERFPWRWTAVITWGGLRGALPMVLALSLPDTFAYRELIVSMTFGVVVLSILIQGVTMPVLLRRLGLNGESPDQLAYETHRVESLTADSVLQELEHMSGRRLVSAQILEPFREEYQRRLEGAGEKLQKLTLDARLLRRRERARVRRHLLVIERDRTMQAFQQGIIGRKGRDRLLADIDARMVETEPENETDTEEPPAPPA